MTYPHVHLADNVAYAPFQASVERECQRFAQECGHSVALRNYFSGISDMSFLGQGASAQQQVIADNTPHPQHVDAPPQDAAAYPSVNIGPWGRDYHQKFERIYAPYSFGQLPELLWRVALGSLQRASADCYAASLLLGAPAATLARMAPSLSPEPQAPSRAQQRRDLLSTLVLVWHSSPAQTLWFALSTLLTSLLPAANLYVSKLLLDAVAHSVSGAEPYAALLKLLGLQVGLVVAGAALGVAQGSARELLSDSLQQRITAQILEKAANLEVERFENADTYDRLQQAYREVGARPVQVATQLVSLGGALITLLSVGGLMARLGPLIVPLVLVSALPAVWVSNRYGVENYRRLRRQTHDARVQNYLGGILTSDALVKEVRLFHLEPYLLTRWREYYRGFRAQLEDIVRRRSWANLAAALASALLVGAASALVLRRAAAGQLTVGDFSLFALGIAQVQSTVSGLLTGVSGIYQNLLYMRNLYEFLELPTRDLDAGKEWQGPIERIEFRDVSFHYPAPPGEERDVLRGLSFTVSRGEALALVGENGAGKTTAMKLLTRLFEPTEGQILLNGQDAAQFSPRSVQRQLSIIFQDFGQYQLQAGENIALADTARLDDDAQQRRAAQAAGASFIDTLPQGLKTPLGRLFQGGRQLSGGQWQRLALARLYFRQASVLVFDEPTAALDARAEFETIEALRTQAAGRITLLISHRFSTTRLADQIVVLDGGRVLEAGSHEQLLARGGRYAALFQLQAAGYADPARITTA